MKYLIKTDGHEPTKQEIASGKRLYRKLRHDAHPIDLIKTAKIVVMTFTDANNIRSWSFNAELF